jgi:hypothetical protein
VRSGFQTPPAKRESAKRDWVLPAVETWKTKMCKLFIFATPTPPHLVFIFNLWKDLDRTHPKQCSAEEERLKGRGRFMHGVSWSDSAERVMARCVLRFRVLS